MSLARVWMRLVAAHVAVTRELMVASVIARHVQSGRVVDMTDWWIAEIAGQSVATVAAAIDGLSAGGWLADTDDQTVMTIPRGLVCEALDLVVRDVTAVARQEAAARVVRGDGEYVEVIDCRFLSACVRDVVSAVPGVRL